MKMWPQSEPLITKLFPQKHDSFIYNNKQDVDTEEEPPFVLFTSEHTGFRGFLPTMVLEFRCPL